MRGFIAITLNGLLLATAAACSGGADEVAEMLPGEAASQPATEIVVDGVKVTADTQAVRLREPPPATGSAR